MAAGVQSQRAVTAHFLSKQLLPFGFAERNSTERGKQILFERDSSTSGRCRQWLDQYLADRRYIMGYPNPLLALWPLQVLQDPQRSRFGTSIVDQSYSDAD